MTLPVRHMSVRPAVRAGEPPTATDSVRAIIGAAALLSIPFRSCLDGLVRACIALAQAATPQHLGLSVIRQRLISPGVCTWR
jgi:hypothetical protein